jgi:hypothetical protein
MKFSMYKSVHAYKIQNLDFSMSCAEKQTEAAKYNLFRKDHITIWSVG